MQKLAGKVALVTGADSGIGQATAIEFAKEGADVVICYYTDKAGAEKTLKEIQKQNRRGAILQVDVGNEQSVEELFAGALQAFGVVDILVNNAGVNGAGIPVADMTAAQFDKTIRTNVYGPFFCARSFIQHRQQQDGKGKIINITSVHEEIPMAGAADYCASKGALRNFTRVLALELAAAGITVNNIAPGMILTPMNQESIDNKAVRDEKAQLIPLKRPGNPDEIGKLAVFLASADADYITGASYFIDGGLMLNQGQGA